MKAQIRTQLTFTLLAAGLFLMGCSPGLEMKNIKSSDLGAATFRSADAGEDAASAVDILDGQSAVAETTDAPTQVPLATNETPATQQPGTKAVIDIYKPLLNNIVFGDKDQANCDAKVLEISKTGRVKCSIGGGCSNLNPQHMGACVYAPAAASWSAKTLNDIYANNASSTGFKIGAWVKTRYTKLLKRNAEIEGFYYWVNDYSVNGGRCRNLNQNFLLSQEFATSIRNDVLNRNSAKFSDYMDRLYQGLFNRAADAPGKAYWMDRLSAGESLDSIESNFLNHAEAQSACTAAGLIF